MRRPIVFPDDSSRCFGCSPHNPAGLRLGFVETDAGVEVEYSAPEHFEGPSGVLHGGIQATLLDEALCMTALAKAGMPVVTGELTLRYLKPVPTAVPIVARGRLVARKGKSVFIEGGIYLVATGEELTQARGRFFAQAGHESRVPTEMPTTDE